MPEVIANVTDVRQLAQELFEGKRVRAPGRGKAEVWVGKSWADASSLDRQDFLALAAWLIDNYEIRKRPKSMTKEAN
jgi:hypothetical protein